MQIGQIFTPVDWAIWLIERENLFELWLQGATVCDPTCGQGSFLEAFVKMASIRGMRLSTEMLSRLHGIEIDPTCRSVLLDRIRRYGVELPETNIHVGDILSPEFRTKYEILVGNPPWVNFSDLNANMRKRWAICYFKYGLVTNRRDVLLGNSRADLATVVLKKVIDDNLVDGGRASFYVPLSIFLNDGSNDRFRPFPGSEHNYRIERMWDFGDKSIFDGVSTRYGAIHIIRRKGQNFPVRTEVLNGNKWLEYFSAPFDGRQGFWQRHANIKEQSIKIPFITASLRQKPRQGVNTCGANHVFFFSEKDGRYFDTNGSEVNIEQDLVFPLIDGSVFSGLKSGKSPRYVLIPHSRASGRPLTARELAAYPETCSYLKQHERILATRKGTMINSHIRRGLWWSLLGVGPYSFAPWKVVWEALGKKNFNPKIVPGAWQGNQAMHAFCPCKDRDEAESLLGKLVQGDVQSFLMASSMGGTMNWAQPGRIAKIFRFEGEQVVMSV